MSPALDNTASPAKQLSPLEAKVAKHQEAAKQETTGYGSIPATVGQGSDGVFLLFDPEAFVLGVGKSDSGKTEGCNLIVSGEFRLTVGDREVTYMIEGRLPLKAKLKTSL